MRRKASILRVAEKHLEGSRAPKWVEPAIFRLIKDKKIKGLNSLNDLKVQNRVKGSVWSWFDKSKSSIMIEVATTRQEIIIYEGEEWREVIDEELTDLLENDPEEARLMYGNLVSLEMRHGDIKIWASEEAQRVREDLSDQLESGSMDEEDLIDMANLKDQWSDAEDLLEEYEKYPESDYRWGYAADARQTLFELPRQAIEEIAEEKYDEVKEALERYPYEYLTEDLGYSEKAAVDALVVDVETSLMSINASVPLQPSHGGKSFMLYPNHTVFVL